MPKISVDLQLLDLKVGYRRQQLGIPVDQSLVAIDQSFLEQPHKDLEDRFG